MNTYRIIFEPNEKRTLNRLSNLVNGLNLRTGTRGNYKMYADLMNVSEMQLKKWLEGAEEFPLDKEVYLCRCIGITLEDIIAENDTPIYIPIK